MKITFLAVICLIAASVHKSDAGANKMQTAQERLAAMKELTDIIKKNDYHLFIDKLSSLAKPAISMVTAVYSFVQDPKADKNQVQQIKSSYNLVNNQASLMSSEFDSVKQAIEWNSIQVNFGNYERAIRAAMYNLKQVMDAPYGAQATMENYFTTEFEADFGNAGIKIYDGIVNEGVFTNNLMAAARKYTKEHRNQVRVFGMGLVQLLLQAIEVEMAYSQMKYNDQHAEFVEDTWSKRLEEIKLKLRREDGAVRLMFDKQAQLDRDLLLQKYRDLSNKEFVGAFYKYMTKKYDWLDWFVIAYNEVTSYSNHAVIVCYGETSFRVQGRNMIYATQEKVFSSFNRGTATRVLDSIKLQAYRALDVVYALGAKTGKTCRPYTLKAAICYNCNVWFIGVKSHFALKKICYGRTCFNVFLFG